jgi:hypothetical protein
MRWPRIISCFSLLALAATSASHAGPLQERRSEWRFSLSRTDRDNVFKDSQANFTWSWIFDKGYHQLGVTTSYFRTEVEGPSPLDTDGTGIGPVYQINFTPTSDKATGFGIAQYEAIGGDFGNRFDSSYLVGIGVRTFTGSTASIVVLYSFEQFQGANGLDDQDQTRLEVGLSIFTGRK